MHRVHSNFRGESSQAGEVGLLTNKFEEDEGNAVGRKTSTA
ncbi:hypothetical protein ACVPOY_00425 [Staphylococcus aureus]